MTKPKQYDGWFDQLKVKTQIYSKKIISLNINSENLSARQEISVPILWDNFRTNMRQLLDNIETTLCPKTNLIALQL